LSTRALLHKQQFSTLKVDVRSIEQDDRLQRKMNFTVKILMKAVVVAGAMLTVERN
jgi:hypothetical protein